MVCNRAFEVAACLAPEPLRYAPREKFRLARHRQLMLAVASFERDETTTAPSADAAGDATQRKDGPVGKGGGRREAF